MSMVKYYFICFSFISGISFAKPMEGMTTFNCENRSVTHSNSLIKNKKNDALNYDGTTRTVISQEAIARAKKTRLFLDHLDKLCSPRLAGEQSNYMEILQNQLKVSPQLIGSVYFYPGSAHANRNRQDLSNIRNAIAQYSAEDYILLIVGSTDATGEDSFNDWLSLRRAQYLAHQVVAKNFDTFLIPLGKKGATDERLESNPRFRRADLYLLKKGI